MSVQSFTPPPSYFKRREAPVCNVEFYPPGTGVRPVVLRGTSGRIAGLRYERKVRDWLARRYDFVDGISFTFDTDEREALRAIPDGLIWTPKHFIIVEIKTVHSIDAYRQLCFYHNILRSWLPAQAFTRLEICEEFRPNVELPSGRRILSSLDEVLTTPSDEHNVFILSRRELARSARSGDTPWVTGVG